MGLFTKSNIKVENEDDTIFLTKGNQKIEITISCDMIMIRNIEGKKVWDFDNNFIAKEGVIYISEPKENKS